VPGHAGGRVSGFSDAQVRAREEGTRLRGV